MALLAVCVLGVTAKAEDLQKTSATVSPVAAAADTVALTQTEITAADTTVVKAKKKKGLIGKIGDYFANSNHYNPNKRIDFSLIGGPHYSSTTGLGLGLVASGLYRIDRSDPTQPLSNLSLFGDVTTSGFLMLGLRGNNILPKKKYRFDYSIYVYNFPSKFWGIGYDAGNIDENETSYSRFKFEVKPRFFFRLAENTYLGPMVNVQYVKASKLDDKGLSLLGENPELEFTAIGGGFSFMYDSRDVILNASRGWFVQLDQLFYPSQFGNKHVYYSTDLTVATYKKVWKGGVLAGEFHSQMNFRDVPWPMLAGVGSPYRMRGYFESRYRDKSIVEAQIELRQHLWRRNGMVVWLGAANVFPEFDAMRWHKTLLNGGFGYRWAFKQGVNVRLDLGFTKNGTGFMFNINEAF